MFDRIKKALRPTKIEPVLLRDVQPTPRDPDKDRQVKDAVGKLITSLVDLERHSYEVRQELSKLTLRAVNRVKK